VAYCQIVITDVYRRQLKFDEAAKTLRLSIATCESHGVTQRLGTAFAAMGEVYDQQSRYGEAEAWYRRVVDANKSAFGTESTAVAHMLNDLATARGKGHADTAGSRRSSDKRSGYPAI